MVDSKTSKWERELSGFKKSLSGDLANTLDFFEVKYDFKVVSFEVNSTPDFIMGIEYLNIKITLKNNLTSIVIESKSNKQLTNY